MKSHAKIREKNTKRGKINKVQNLYQWCFELLQIFLTYSYLPDCKVEDKNCAKAPETSINRNKSGIKTCSFYNVKQ